MKVSVAPLMQFWAENATIFSPTNSSLISSFIFITWNAFHVPFKHSALPFEEAEARLEQRVI